MNDTWNNIHTVDVLDLNAGVCSASQALPGSTIFGFVHIEGIFIALGHAANEIYEYQEASGMWNLMADVDYPGGVTPWETTLAVRVDDLVQNCELLG